MKTFVKKLRDNFVCWWSYWYYDIHSEEDDVRKIPDAHKEYTCQRCGKMFKL